MSFMSDFSEHGELKLKLFKNWFETDVNLDLLLKNRSCET